MFKKNNSYKLLKVFLDDPLEEFGLRELGRLSGISPSSVINYLKEFGKEGLVKKFVKKQNPLYIARRDNLKFINFKKLSILYELEECGFLNFLEKELCPNAIILYGSYSKGESVKESDVDIFVIGKEEKIDISKFEKRLNREIHLMFEEEPKKIPKEFKNNLANGIILRGYFNVI